MSNNQITESSHVEHSGLLHLLYRKILTCSICRQPLTSSASVALKCEADHSFAIEHGVLDLYRNVAISDEQSPPTPSSQVFTDAIANRVGISPAILTATNLFEPLPSTNNPFFDAEERLFLERFAFQNVEPRLSVLKIYSTGRMIRGTTQTLAVRVRNTSAFRITSTGERPVLLSYHWLRPDGTYLVFEGMRTALPLDLEPGKEITAHVTVAVPNEDGLAVLKIVPVHEHVAWLEDDGASLDVKIGRSTESRPKTRDAGRPFSEPLDDTLSNEFLTRFLSSHDGAISAVEIGGGIISALSRWFWVTKQTGVVINCDVSVRLLRVAAVISSGQSDHSVVHSRFDANAMPIQSDSLDVALFSRSLHHFEDPIRVLKECHRVLKPGGLLFLLCEPVGVQYDDFIRDLIRNGVNEQLFPLDGYEAMIEAANFTTVDIDVDWGFSLKGAFRKA